MSGSLYKKLGDPVGGVQRITEISVSETDLLSLKGSAIRSLESEEIAVPYEGQIIYNKDLNINFMYTDGDWVQCGEETILSGGLISGSLYVNKLTVG